MSERVTVCIPTKDRLEHVARLLRYYAAAGFKGVLLIGDATEDAGSLRMLEPWAGDLRVTVYHWPGCPTGATIRRLADAVDTDFAVYSGDDDYLLPAGLDAAVEALDQWRYHNVVAVGGSCRWFRWADDYSPRIIGSYPLGEELAEEPDERVREYLSAYWPALWCVTRSRVWRDAWADLSGVIDPAMGAEVGPSSLIVQSGRIGKVEEPYLLRERHSSHAAWQDFPAWVESAAFSEGYGALRAAMQDRCPWGGDPAEEALREGLGRWLDTYKAPSMLQRHPMRAEQLGRAMAANETIHAREAEAEGWADALRRLT